MQNIICGLSLQYYEKLSPSKAPESAAAPSADIAAALESEMEELKQQDGKLFAYHSTGVSGLAYITMKADAGKPLMNRMISCSGGYQWSEVNMLVFLVCRRTGALLELHVF